MPNESRFSDFITRVRSGDAQAAEELVRQYESTIRIAARTHLTSAALRQRFDSMDVCQSVMASFFMRAALGQYDLIRLLVRMAQNKVVDQVRKTYRRTS